MHQIQVQFNTSTAAEISAGIATLTLRGFPLNGCGAFVDDTKTLNIDRSPSVNLNTTIIYVKMMVLHLYKCRLYEPSTRL